MRGEIADKKIPAISNPYQFRDRLIVYERWIRLISIE